MSQYAGFGATERTHLDSGGHQGGIQFQECCWARRCTTPQSHLDENEPDAEKADQLKDIRGIHKRITIALGILELRVSDKSNKRTASKTKK